MKDKRLEKEFDEYFKGVSTPDNITADAKKYVKPKNSFMPKLLKIASVMASCVLVITLSVIFITNRPSVAPPGENQPPVDGSTPSEPSVSTPYPSTAYYYDTELTLKDADAYDLPENLKAITKLAHSGNTNVYDCTAYYSDEELMLFSAKVDMVYSLTRYDAQMYIEFASDKVYAPLKDYSEGQKQTYKGTQYYITRTTSDNGEPQFKLCAAYKGVKYYFDIISSDEQAFIKYLELIIKNY